MGKLRGKKNLHFSENLKPHKKISQVGRLFYRSLKAIYF